MTITRRNLLAGAGAGALALTMGRAFAEKAEFNYKYANNLPVTHPMNLRAKEMVEAIRTETKGRVDIQIFPNNQLGSDTDMLSQLRSGGIELFTMSGLILSTLVPAASINGIGFAFADYAAVWKAMDGDLGKYVRAQIEKVGLLTMSKPWDNGFRQVTTSSKPVRTPDDLRGMKLRVPSAPMLMSLFQALGAGATPINFNEVYSALQTKLVEGQENALPIIATARLYEVQQYCAMTNHVWDAYWILGNKKAVERLPKDIQEIVAREFGKSAVDERADILALGHTLRADLTAKGLKFVDVDKKAFKDALAKTSFYKDWRGKFGEEAWKLLQDNVGSLG